MKLVNIFIGLLILLFTPVFVSAQSTAFGVDGSTFPLVNLVSFPVPAGTPITPIGLTVGGQGGDFGPGGVFYSTVSQNLLTFNLTTGEPIVGSTITGVDPAHQPLIGMAYDHSTGIMYATGHKIAPFDSELYTLDLTTAVATFIGTITNSDFVGALAVNCAGELFGIDLQNDNLMRINTTTAEGTIIGSLNFDSGLFAQDVDFDPSDGTLYWTAFNGTSGELRTIDVTTGNSTQVNDWSADIYIFSIQGDCGATGVDETNAIPSGFDLAQNFPNPFNPATVIKYQTGQGEVVELAIYNLLGQKVRVLINETKPAGSYEARWDGTDDRGSLVSSGVYVYRLQAGKFAQTKKMLLLR